MFIFEVPQQRGTEPFSSDSTSAWDGTSPPALTGNWAQGNRKLSLLKLPSRKAIPPDNSQAIVFQCLTNYNISIFPSNNHRQSYFHVVFFMFNSRFYKTLVIRNITIVNNAKSLLFQYNGKGNYSHITNRKIWTQMHEIICPNITVWIYSSTGETARWESRVLPVQMYSPDYFSHLIHKNL